MIRVSTKNEAFKHAYLNARRYLPVEPMERPSQFGERWSKTYKCRIEHASGFPDTYYVFDRDEDYTWFMLRWA